MQTSLNRSVAALAAVILAFTSISAIVTVPPASAGTASHAITATELA